MDYIIIKKLHQCKKRGLYETYPYMNTPAVVSAMNRMNGKGYFRVWTTAEQAESLTIPILKNLLQEVGLSCQGKKSDLISRVLQSVPPDRIYVAAGSFDQLRLTDAGQTYFSYLEQASNREYDNLIEEMRAYLLRGDFNSANHIMCEYETRQFFKRGMGIDWEKRASQPLPASEQYAINTYFEQSQDLQSAATIVIYRWLSSPNDFRQYMERHPERYVDPTQLHYGNSVLGSMQKLAEYAAEDGKHARYKVHNHCEDICDICKIHSGKTYYVKDARIGQNCPPFHFGCRCCVSPVVTFADGTEVKPVIRDPKKSIFSIFKHK